MSDFKLDDDIIREHSFKKYWEHNKVVYEKMGLSEDIVYKIWSDGVDTCIDVLKDAVLDNIS